MESGGWEVLNKWLNEGKDDENKEFLQDLLTVYGMLPVSVETLRQNNCARTIKQIAKTAEGGRMLTTQHSSVQRAGTRTP